MRRLAVCSGALMAGWTALILASQGPTIQQRKPLRSTVELTVVTATVRNADGQLVPGLPK
jgi:hypothetical protein